MIEDRVITTDQLADANAGTGIYLQLGAGVLGQLDPVGLHVLVPRAPVPAGDGEPPMLCCDAQLRVRDETEPLTIPVVVSVDMFIELPTAFEVLGVAAALVPATAAGIEHRATGD